MTLKILFIYLIIFLSFSKIQLQSQNLNLKNHHLQTGIDYKNNYYLVFSGFETYFKKHFDSLNWKRVEYKHNKLPISKNFPYQFFHIEDKNYLVYNGCGSVYEFRNDSIVRIDNSFEHKNQFGAASFVYNNEIYFFGGYGLFTFKNILTKFDFKTKEWELVKYSSTELPQPRDKIISFLKNDNFYVLSGYTEINNGKQLTENSKQVFDTWKLNFKTKSWEFLGKLNNENYFNTIKKGSSYSVDGKFYSDYNRLLNIDLADNKLNLYKPNNKYSISYSEKYNPITKEIIYALPNSNDSDKHVKIIVEPFSKYSGTITDSKPLLKSQLKLLLGGIFGFAILVGILVLRRKVTSNHNNVISLKEEKFYHKNKLITNLTIDEALMLKFLFEHKERLIQVSQLIDLISDNDTTNYNTLAKKKDLVFNSLKQKLGFILDTKEEHLFIYSKNEKDKRIKEIQLNDEFFC